MTIHDPCCITSRLLPGIRIGDVEISITPDRGEGGRVYWRHWIEGPGWRYTDDDLSTGSNHSPQTALCALLAFLGYVAESYDPLDLDSADMFPPIVCQWAHENASEIGYAALVLDETPNIIDIREDTWI